MADGYNIKVNVDSRGAERGVKQFTTAVSDSLKQLRDFDSRARSAFKALDSFQKLNVGNLTKSANSVATAVKILNSIKVNTRVTENLQAMARAVNGIKFTGGSSLKALPAALKDLSKIKIDSKLVSDLNGLKGAISGFRAPPASLSQWPKALAAFSKVSIPASLSKQVEAVKLAMRGFTGPSKSALAIPAFLRGIESAKLSPAIGNQIANIKGAMAGLTGPSAATARNIKALLDALKSTSGSQIKSVVAQLEKLNGINIRLGGALGRTTQGLQRMGSQSRESANAMRLLYQQSALMHNAFSMIQAALGGLTFTAFIKGVYEAGTSFQSFQRTITAVSASQEEAAGHIKFITDLTKQIPISLEAATSGYKKFAVSALLAGTSVEDTQKIFKGFSTGFVAMGISAESTSYAFTALEQIMSKGKVTAEDLKEQLGEHLPGTMSILSKALGKPVGELYKMMQQGQITSDVLIKMAEVVQNQFEPAAKQMANSTQGAFTQLGNAWTVVQKKIFASGFDAALGALAKSLTDILSSEKFLKFAGDVGQAFGRLFKAVSLLATFLWSNKDAVIGFLKAFAGYAAIASAGMALRLFLAPLQLVGGLAASAGLGISALSRGMLFLASGGALRAVITFFSMFSKRLLIAVASVAVLVAGVYGLVQGIDALAGTDIAGTLTNFGNGALETAGKIVQGIKDISGGVVPDVSDELTKNSAAFDDYMKKINESNAALNAPTGQNDLQKQNEADRAKIQADKEKALNTEQQKLWDSLNIIGKETAEYERQLVVLDEIAKKRNIDPATLAAQKQILAQQTLAKRDPVGADMQDMQLQLAAAKALTAEDKAQVEAERWKLQMLEKGVPVTQQMVDSVKQFNEGIAKMQGEAGNGFERWAASVKNWNDSMQDAIKDGIGGLSDQLTNFVTGADADFAGLARSILASFVKIQIDSLMKDMLTGIGQNGAVNGANEATNALKGLTSANQAITAQQANIYAAGVTLNGQPLGTNPLQSAVDNASPGSITSKASTWDMKPTLPTNVQPNGALPGVSPTANYDLTKVNAASNAPLTLAPDAEAEKQRLQAIEAHKAGDWSDMPGGIMPANYDPATGLPKVVATPTLPTTTNQVVANPALVPPASIPSQTLQLSTADVENMKKTLATEWVPSAGQDQGKGILDTIMNRQASGHWGETTADVVNARKQFSDINGPVAWKDGRTSVDDLVPGQNMSMSQYNRASTLTDSYLAQRAAGQPSIVGDNLNYANPTFSDAKNRPWIEALDGPRLGTNSQNTHYHGTVPDLQQYKPGDYQVKLPGQETTNSVPADTSAIKDSTAALNQAMPSFDKFKTTITDTGTKTMTSSTQVQQGLQTQTTATQQNATAMQTSATSVQLAGQNAQQASPQFQQAGQSLQQAGQNAQTAGQAAQTANPGLSSMSSGINGLIAPLSSAIPSLGTFSSVLSTLGSLGTPSVTGGLFKEGGISTSPVSSGSMPSSAWANAPHYRDGTANTSGGMPAVLHPNEAVIPLTRGREVPVKIDSTQEEDYKTEYGKQRAMVGAPNVQLILNGVKSGDDFKRSKRQAQAMVADGMQQALRRNS